VKEGVEQASEWHDIWRANDIPVSQIPEMETHWKLWLGFRGQISEIQGHFVWTGNDSGIES
jgi:hypothetical protein